MPVISIPLLSIEKVYIVDKLSLKLECKDVRTLTIVTNGRDNKSKHFKKVLKPATKPSDILHRQTCVGVVLVLTTLTLLTYGKSVCLPVCQEEW